MQPPAPDRPFVSYFDYAQHAPVRPPLEGGRELAVADVVIVGGGPIGFALALGLARHGTKSVVLEADESVCTGSRAGCVTRRTLEIFEQLGVAAPVERQGLAWSEGWSHHGTREVFHLQTPPDAEARYPALLNIQQCYVEQFMVDEIERLSALIEVRWQNRVESVVADADGVELGVGTPDGGYRMRARWVVACDGAKSTVRRALGLRFVGTRYEGRYVIVDIRMRSALPAGRRAWFDPPSNPGATLLLHKHTGDLWRFDYQLGDDEDADEAVKPENVLARVQSHLELMGETADWNPVWISLYSASALTLESYRHGRVLFAGDAAHLVPIFGVRGMNSGIDDTWNLAWKLAAVCRGKADDALLDSYSSERVFATRENIRNASKSAEFMAPPTPAFARMRKAVLALAETEEWVKSLINPRQSTAIGLPESPLNIATGDAFAGGPAPGANVPDVVLGEGRHLSSLLRPGFTALVVGERDAAIEEERRDASGLPLFVVRLPLVAALEDRLDAAPGTTYLVRPDGHVLARWRRFDAASIDAAIARTLHPRAPAGVDSASAAQATSTGKAARPRATAGKREAAAR